MNNAILFSVELTESVIHCFKTENISLIDLLQVICYFLHNVESIFSSSAIFYAVWRQTFILSFSFSAGLEKGNTENYCTQCQCKITQPVHKKIALSFDPDSTRREHQNETDTKDFF